MRNFWAGFSHHRGETAGERGQGGQKQKNPAVAGFSLSARGLLGGAGSGVLNGEFVGGSL